MKTLFASNETKWRLVRTIIQGIIGVIIAYIDVIVGAVPFIDQTMRPIIVALAMAVLSPLMAELGGKIPENDDGE